MKVLPIESMGLPCKRTRNEGRRGHVYTIYHRGPIRWGTEKGANWGWQGRKFSRVESDQLTIFLIVKCYLSCPTLQRRHWSRIEVVAIIIVGIYLQE
jgi:hypothetical protein